MRTSTTLREICSGLGIEVPEKYDGIADEERGLSFRSKRTHKGDICLIIRSGEDFHSNETPTKDQYDIAIAKGASLIIMGREAFAEAGLSEEKFPVILMDDSNRRVASYISTLRDQQKGKVVMLTGSIGKTTTKDLCSVIATTYFDTFYNKRNTNTPHQIVKHLFENSEHSYETYIQESGAGYWGSVRFSAEMLRPDIFILTNIYGHHLQVYKTIENLFNDKSAADDTMPEDGVIITNYDDEIIRNHSFKHRVMSFAVDNKKADYVAENIRQEFERLRFDIRDNNTGTVTPISLHILGVHNAYNALAAFAMGRELGLSEQQIADALKKYSTQGVRQNLTDIGGIHLYMDCYNVAEESILSMIKSGEAFSLKDGARKIALIGGENKLGKDVRTRSEKFGESISRIGFDKVLFCGRAGESIQVYGDAEDIIKGFRKKSRIPCELSMDVDSMREFLASNVRQGDLVMVKGIYNLDMPIAVDKALGTSYSFDLSVYKAEMQKIDAGKYSFNLVPTFGEVEVTAAPSIRRVLQIPDAYAEHPVFRIGNGAFKARKVIQEIDFGHSVRNIGQSAFSECPELTYVDIPGNVSVIEDRAFAKCNKLREVVIREGTIHIGSEVFAGCTRLRAVHIPASVGRIEDDAFKGLSSIMIVCPRDSYAWNYAVSHKMVLREA